MAMATNNTKIKPRGNLIAALDVGTNKVCCFIARIANGSAPKVIGIGHQISHGVRGGVVIDMELLKRLSGPLLKPRSKWRARQ